MAHILVVDDDQDIANLISIYLKNEGFAVTKACNGKLALERLASSAIDLIVLDSMMPEMDGLEVCRTIREREKDPVPILMLSAKSEDMDKILGLMTGADDYMIKPFNPLELIARVKSLLRRSYQYMPQRTKEQVLQVGALEIDKEAYSVICRGEPIALTAKEFDILALLAGSRGKVFSSEEIFEHVWKEAFYSSNNTVMVHISNLRDKIEKAAGYKMIQTVWGVGYKIEE